MTQEHDSPPPEKPRRALTVDVIQSTEPIDFDRWVATYVASLIDAEGVGRQREAA